MRKPLALIASCALFSSVAAQVSIPTGATLRAPPPPRDNRDAGSAALPAPAGRKSAALAVGLSVVATGLPIFLATRARTFGESQTYLVAFGVIAGPSAGYLYAGVDGAWEGMFVRGGVIALTGGFAITSLMFCGPVMLFAGSEAVCSDIAIGIGVIGVAFVAGLTIYDIVKLPSAVRAKNEGIARVAVVPLFDPSTHSAGAAVRITF